MKDWTPENLRKATILDPTIAKLIHQLQTWQVHNWKPRKDDVEAFDEQTSFVESAAKFSVCLGGTGSGKTTAAAFKTAKFLLENPAPRKDTPFWVIGETYELTCAVCWEEKLRHFIPQECIAKIDWYKQARVWPNAVVLRDLHNTGTNWAIEFKSYMQGRSRMQARSIGGYWFNEEVPFSIVEEVQGRCRDYDSPGWADFTPIEIRDAEWPEAYEEPPEGWDFFHLNTAKNTALAPGWFERWLKTIPADMRMTRQYGTFTTFKGQVFKEWNRKIHVVEPFEIPDDWLKFRGIDFGFNNAFCCLWAARDRDGRWYFYDEHFMPQQSLAYHADQIKARPWLKRADYRCTYADHDAQDRFELARLGIPTTAAKKDVRTGIEIVRRLLIPQADGKPKFYVFSNCENLIREMRNYRWAPAVGEGTDRERDPVDMPWPYDDHAVDAARYIVFSEHQAATHFAKPLARQVREWERESAGRFL